MERPSHKELFKKIREARAAVEAGKVMIVNPVVVASDALELGYLIDNELIDVLSHLLVELAPGHYVGKKPPEKSYDQNIERLDLFAFRLLNRRFECTIYLKFALQHDIFWLVSLHRHREKEEKT